MFHKIDKEKITNTKKKILIKNIGFDTCGVDTFKSERGINRNAFYEHFSRDIFYDIPHKSIGEKKQATFCNVLGAWEKKNILCLVSPKNKLLIKLAIDREREEIEIPCASSNYSEINLRMGKQNKETETFFVLGVSVKLKNKHGRTILEECIHKFFPFPLRFTYTEQCTHRRVYTIRKERKEKSILQKSSTHTQNNWRLPFTGTFAFPWTRFSHFSKKFRETGNGGTANKQTRFTRRKFKWTKILLFLYCVNWNFPFFHRVFFCFSFIWLRWSDLFV